MTTLPSSGQISISDINNTMGNPSTYSTDLNFLNGVITPSQRPSTPNMDSFHGKNYFQANIYGNCDNGNCTQTDCDCNCDSNCSNCINCYAINCANCDAQAWLQTDCNCACTYNCTQRTHPYACACTDCTNCW